MVPNGSKIWRISLYQRSWIVCSNSTFCTRKWILMLRNDAWFECVFLVEEHNFLKIRSKTPLLTRHQNSKINLRIAGTNLCAQFCANISVSEELIENRLPGLQSLGASGCNPGSRFAITGLVREISVKNWSQFWVQGSDNENILQGEIQILTQKLWSIFFGVPRYI